MKILSKIFTSKAYPCIIYYNRDKWKIFSCEWDVVRSGEIENDYLTTIRSFYQKMGLFIPTEEDFIINEVSLGRNIYVVLNGNNLYNVSVKAGTCTDHDLIKNINYEVAIDKANAIINIIGENY